MITHYVKQKPTTRLLQHETDYPLTELLWGDPVHLEQDWDSDAEWAYVRARGQIGWVKKSHLQKKSASFNGLLEFYVIDVGQGDGVLCRTPDDHWHLIDAGVPNYRQMTKKGAANFLRWKFYEDLRMKKINLKTLTASHPDIDHYGGMLDLLEGKLYDGRTFKVDVDTFYHSGMGRFIGNNPLGKMKKGTVKPIPNPGYQISRTDYFITELLDDLNSFQSPSTTLSASYGQLADLVTKKCKSAKRISLDDKYLPGYAPGDGKVTIHVLGPVLEKFGTSFGLRRLGPAGNKSTWEGKTRNGHSIVYRFDYGNARILMTGDLNDESQRLLMSYVDKKEYSADVAKGCHHGSEDVNLGFIEAMKARATAISSGDNESYSHPRPLVMGASARYGRDSKTLKGEVMPPLIYSTELARSVELEYPTSVRLDPDSTGPKKERMFSAKITKVKTPKTKYRPLYSTPISSGLIYGLVNIRTDGKTILCGTMEESGSSFDTKMFQAGVDVI